MENETIGVNDVFPEPVRKLPLADLPLPGATAYISQAPNHQVLFMHFAADAEVAPHAHAGQWGVVLAGWIDLVIGGEAHSFGPGGRYFIPAGVVHSARIHAGYADITFFDQADRYGTVNR